MNESDTSSSIRYSPDFRKNNGCCFFCHELFLPEQAIGRRCHFCRALVRRRTASASAPSSGHHSPAGGEIITGSSTPAKGAFAGGRRQTKKKGTEGPQTTRFLTFIKQLYHPQSPTLPVSFPARVFSPPNFP